MYLPEPLCLMASATTGMLLFLKSRLADTPLFCYLEMVDAMTNSRRAESNNFLWGILAFQGGWINAGGFLACHRFVSHITGFATQFGYDLASFKIKDSLGMLSVPFFFLLGSYISGYEVARHTKTNTIPRYDRIFLLISVLLLTTTVLGIYGSFGSFGQELNILASYELLAMLCLSSGLQNAVTSTASQNLVRTTHLTGTTTDLGIQLAQLVYNKDSDLEKTKLLRTQVQIRFIIIFSFILGTAISSFLFLKFGFWGFLIPTLISFFIFYSTRKAYLKC